jgi:hypothetical protein
MLYVAFMLAKSLSFTSIHFEAIKTSLAQLGIELK